MAGPDLAAQGAIDAFDSFYCHSLVAARGRTGGRPLGRDAMTFRARRRRAAVAGRHA
jgi:hypothetical protein